MSSGEELLESVCKREAKSGMWQDELLVHHIQAEQSDALPLVELGRGLLLVQLARHCPVAGHSAQLCLT